MNISKETQAALEQVLGQRLTERRLKDWLKTVTPPERGIGSEDCTDQPMALTEEHLQKARAVIKQASQKLPSIQRKPMTNLDEAAILLLGVMEQNHQDVVKDVSQENGWPIWVVMLGAVARGADNRELNSADVASEWLNEPGKVQAAQAVVTCHAEGCGLEIPSARRGQVWCCNAHGSGKLEHSVGCPAALAAGIDVSPKDTKPAEETPKPAAPLVATGTCQRCQLPILGGRPGQLFCCTSHGCDRDEHSDGCETGKAALEQHAS